MEPTTEAQPSPDAKPRERALGRTAVHGAAWTMLQTIVRKGIGYLALIPLGYFLTKDQWGIYATSVAFAGFVMLTRQGGVRELLAQRGVKEYETLIGPVFWVAFAFNILTAGLLAAAAPFAVWFYKDERMLALVLIPAVTIILNTPALILRTKLRIDLRFSLFSRLAMFSSIIQWSLAVTLAWLGFGPKSLVLPFPVVAIFEWIVLGVLTRERLFRRRPEPRRWPGILQQTKWLIFGTLAMLTLNRGAYLVLGKVADTVVLGTYYFGYMLVAQTAMLLADNLQTVFVPTLARLNDEPERQRAAVIRALRSITMFGSFISLGVGVVIVPVEQVVWHGKYADAVVAAQLLATTFPTRLTNGLVTSSLNARGMFKAWSLLTLTQGFGLMVTAYFAGRSSSGAAGIAAWIAAYIGVSGIAILLAGFKLQGIRAWPTLGALLPAWALALACAGACELLRRGALLPLPPIVQILVLGGVFTVLYGALVRTFMARRCVDLLVALPAPVRRVGQLVLALNLPPRNASAAPYGQGPGSRPGGPNNSG